jgi:hypothetical protein
MSLKGFHIVFVTVSSILAVGFGVWSIRQYTARGDTSALVIGIVSLVGAAVMVVYGRWFLNKLKGVRTL